MIETITIITLTLIFISLVRPGKTPPLDNPLVIERGGQFRATIAPKLNLAQPLLEAISKNLPAQTRAAGDTEVHYYAVHDSDVKAHGADHYLFAVMLHHGMLHFHVAAPQSTVPDLAAIQAHAANTFAGLPPPGTASPQAAQSLSSAIQDSAAQLRIKVEPLTA